MRSERTTLAETRLGQTPLRLIHRTAGIAPAGAAMVQVREAWGAITESAAGTTHGQWFRTLDEARVRYEAVREANS